MSLIPCQYKTGKKLGQGSYAIVREAIHSSTGTKYAVKIISKQLMKGREHLILNEINILKTISKGHPNIITLYDYFETPNNLYLVMELCQGGELFDRIYDKGFYFETDAAHTIAIVLDAVAYLHDQNIVHRDIKPENLIFKTNNEEDLILGDFGLSKIMTPDQFDMLQTKCGTPEYMAPEVIRRLGHGKPVDLWSIGVLTYFLLSGYTPFDGNSSSQELFNIVNAKFEFEPQESWSGISQLAKNFITSLLQVNPQMRPTAREAQLHPWILTFCQHKSQDTMDSQLNLLPMFKEKFDAKKAFKKAIGMVRAVNKLGNIPLQKQGAEEIKKKSESRTSTSVSLDELADLVKPIDESSADGTLLVLEKLSLNN